MEGSPVWVLLSNKHKYLSHSLHCVRYNRSVKNGIFAEFITISLIPILAGLDYLIDM